MKNKKGSTDCVKTPVIQSLSVKSMLTTQVDAGWVTETPSTKEGIREFSHSPSSRSWRLARGARRLPRNVAKAAIWVYRKGISPHFPPSCRYTPTCSEYAWEAIDRYGLIRGSWLAAKRVSRCHPFHEGGYDPVP